MNERQGDDSGQGLWKLRVVGLGALALVVSSCAPMAPSVPVETPWTAGQELGNVGAAGLRAGDSALTRNQIDAILNNPERRPGLGTGWGRQVGSKMSYTSFNRASSKPHGSVGVIYYNDREGVNAMTGWKSSGSSMQSAAGGLVEWGVKGSSGWVKNYRSGGRRLVVGKNGQRYSLMVKNKAKSRLEMVLSVDGLDVMDGKPGSTKKRGYIVEPGKTLEVKGWRTSQATVASFRFSSVGGSYANLKNGDTRNVGVIGLAVYTEKGVDPFTWMPREVAERGAASPFAEAPMHRAR